MGILQHGAAIPSGASSYVIDHSVKLEDTAGEHLRRNAGGSDGNRRTMTLSMWLKRTQPGNDHIFFSQGSHVRFRFKSSDYFSLRLANGHEFEHQARLFRDPNAWMHLVVAIDTTQGTASNRVKIYWNGEQETNLPDANQPPDQNEQLTLGQFSSVTTQVGWFVEGGYGFDGYISEVNYIDGIQKAPTDFGEFNSDGIWTPIEYEGSYGNEGYFLNFISPSDMGNDNSGNNNDFAVESVNQNDQATDTPTNNFCTLNPLIPYAVQSGSPVISQGATYHNGSGGWTGMKGTIGINKGKWYWELQTNSGSGGDLIYGVQTVEIINSQSESTATSAHNLKETAAWYVSGGHWIADQTSNRDDVAASSVSHTVGNSVVYGIGLNMDDGEVTYYANGSAITNLTNIDLDGLAGETVAPFCSVYNQAVRWNLGGYTTISISSAATDANGYGTFEYAPPSGYYSLCTQNLAQYG